jgi:L-amino acid N-acyltransferase YncA
VLDEHQGEGIGSILLQHLDITGRAQGIRQFQADVLADNRGMFSVFERSGFPISRSIELGMVRLLIAITDEAEPV